jgi:hypothetical protein
LKAMMVVISAIPRERHQQERRGGVFFVAVHGQLRVRVTAVPLVPISTPAVPTAAALEPPALVVATKHVAVVVVSSCCC